MKRYLSTLHTRSHRHRKNFALLVSGLFTLLIFTIWSIIHLGAGGQTDIAALPAITTSETANALSPLAGLKETFSNSLTTFKESINQAKAGLNSVDIQNGYNQVRDEALNTNGQ
jgi:hypothetical protein